MLPVKQPPQKRRRISVAARESVSNHQEIIDLTLSESDIEVRSNNDKVPPFAGSTRGNDSYSYNDSDRDSESDSDIVVQSNNDRKYPIDSDIEVKSNNENDHPIAESTRCDNDNDAQSTDDNAEPPIVGSLYRKRDGTVLGVRSVDTEKRQAECLMLVPSQSAAHGRQTKDSNSVVVLPFKKFPSSCSVEDWKYTFDPEVKHEFSILRTSNRPKKTRRDMKKKIATLELFAGAGGMSQGLLAAAKMDVKWAVEKNTEAIGTLDRNLPKDKTQIFTECVYTFLDQSKKGKKTHPRKGEVEHIHASPPCQGVSLANRTGGKNDAANNQLSFAFIDAVRHFMPLTVTYENVMGLTSHAKGEILFRMIADLCSMNFQVRVCVLNASHYGDPQVRKRIVIFAAHESMCLPERPQPTHGIGRDLKPVRTVREAIGPLSNFGAFTSIDKSGIYIEGKKIEDHCAPRTKNLDKDNREYTKLEADKPAPTLKTQNRLIHYEHDRFLTVREYAALQSFHLTWKFTGTEEKKLRQIGNAVPRNMATRIARSIVDVYGF